MKIHVDAPYLWMPVDTKKPEVKLHFYCGGEKFQEVDIQLGGTDGDFYTAMDVSRFLGQDIVVKSEVEEEKLYNLFCYSEKVQNVYPFRPQVHFAPEIGWINDPNGLVYADGVYHLYHQWNPYGVIWGNMHWGHAVSRDMITWEHKPMVMEPDQYGTMYSGCGWQDKTNAAGFGKNTLLFFYTTSGGNNQWSVSKGHQHAQRLALSRDGGETLQKIDGVLIDHIIGGNRDPKVFYHAPSNAYIMVLFLEDYEFAIFRSADLLHWTISQRFSAEKMRECPDLFELPVVNVGGKTKWVFWSADGYYLVGAFDGYRFTPETDVQSAYDIPLAYAAQTYAGIEGRVITVGWLRTENIRGHYKGMMSLPAELSLVETKQGYHIRFQPTKEFLQYREPIENVSEILAGSRLSGRATELVLNWAAQSSGCAELKIGDVTFSLDFAEKQLKVSNANSSPDSMKMDGSFDLDIVVDQGVIEFYGNDGLVYGAIEPEENILHKSIALTGTAVPETVQMYQLFKE